MGSGTTLPTKIARNAYIRYLEQGLTVALALYRAGSPTNCKMSLGSRVINSVATAVVNFEAKLPYLGTNTEGGILANVGVSSGKKYWEVLLGDNVAFNVGFAPSTHDVQANSIADAYVIGSGKVNSLGVAGSNAVLVAGQTVGVALDMSAGTANFYLIGNTTTTLAVSGIDTSKTWHPCLLGTGSNLSSSWGTIKAKASEFVGAIPSGYAALETE